MLRISLGIGFCVVLLWAGFLFYFQTAGKLQQEDMPLMAIITAATFVTVVALSYLGGWIVNGHTGAFRLGVILTFIYWIPVYVENNDFEDFLGIGILPAAVFWGTIWVIRGFKGKRPR